MNTDTTPTPPTLMLDDAAIAVGFDACDIEAWGRCLDEGGEALLRRTYRTGELDECAGRVDRLSTRLAAKEAVAKALGTGFCNGVTFTDVEVVTSREGHPSVRLHGGAAEQARRAGITSVHVSLSHESGMAYAYVVAAGTGAGS